jgi:hypothetical protein
VGKIRLGIMKRRRNSQREKSPIFLLLKKEILKARAVKKTRIEKNICSPKIVIDIERIPKG